MMRRPVEPWRSARTQRAHAPSLSLAYRRPPCVTVEQVLRAGRDTCGIQTAANELLLAGMRREHMRKSHEGEHSNKRKPQVAIVIICTDAPPLVEVKVLI